MGVLMRVWLVLATVLALVALLEATERWGGGSTDYVPVVLWHGMGDTCCFPFSMGHIKRLIQKELPGIYVYSVMVGNNILEDEIHGFIGNVNDQIAQVAGKFLADEKLERGFNAVGFSQGGQFLRGYVEQYNKPPVGNLVTMGGQHQGVFGIPDCSAQNHTICEALRRIVDLGAYRPEIQEYSVQAQYWHDPLQEDLYKTKGIFMPAINNYGSYNQTYKDNLLSLQNFAMVQFMNDTVVIPRESEWFGFYAPGQDKQVIPMEQTEIYLQDTIGLQELNKSGRLWQLECEGNHLEFSDEYFIQQIITPFLNQTFSS